MLDKNNFKSSYDVEIYTDASTRRIKDNKFHTGIGYLIRTKDNEFSGFENYEATISYGELMAIHQSLTFMKRQNIKAENLIIFSDSEYCVKTINAYYKSWYKRCKNFLFTSQKKLVSHQYLITDIIDLLISLSDRYSVVHIASHGDEKGIAKVKSNFDKKWRVVTFELATYLSKGNQFVDKLSRDSLNDESLDKHRPFGLYLRLSADKFKEFIKKGVVK